MEFKIQQLRSKVQPRRVSLLSTALLVLSSLAPALILGLGGTNPLALLDLTLTTDFEEGVVLLGDGLSSSRLALSIWSDALLIGAAQALPL